MFVCSVCKKLTITACCEADVNSKQHTVLLNDIVDSKVVTAKNLESNTTQVYCSKCGSNNVQVIILQNRSADESATMRIQCLDCGAKESV